MGPGRKLSIQHVNPETRPPKADLRTPKSKNSTLRNSAPSASQLPKPESRKPTPLMTSKEKVELITTVADDMKAEQIETLDVRDKTSIADYFVLCTGTNDRQISSIADEVEKKMRDKKERPLRTEGDGSGWVLQDYGDVVLHIMRDEQRQFYDLETLWKTMQPDQNLK